MPGDRYRLLVRDITCCRPGYRLLARDIGDRYRLLVRDITCCRLAV